MASTELVLIPKRTMSKQRIVSILKSAGALRENTATNPPKGVMFSAIHQIGPKPSKKTNAWITKRKQHEKKQKDNLLNFASGLQSGSHTSQKKRETAVLSELERSTEWEAASDSEKRSMQLGVIEELTGWEDAARVQEYEREKTSQPSEKPDLGRVTQWLVDMEAATDYDVDEC